MVRMNLSTKLQHSVDMEVHIYNALHGHLSLHFTQLDDLRYT